MYLNGWKLADKQYAITPHTHTALPFIRPSVAPSDQLKSLGERLQILDEKIKEAKAGKNEEEMRAFSIFYSDIQFHLVSLEQEEKPSLPGKVNLVDLLERLSALHRDGSLSDAEFERAKKEALGL